MIDRGRVSVRQSTVGNIWASLPGAGYGCLEHTRLTAWLQKFKEAGGTLRLMYEQSHRDYLRSVICIIVCLSCTGLIITVITPLPAVLQRQKCQRTGSWRTRHHDMQMRQRDVAAPDAKYTKELADAKAENMPAWWCCRWSSSVAHQSSPSVSAWSHHASGVDNAASWLADTAERGLFHPQREADHYAKTTGKEPRSILMIV